LSTKGCRASTEGGCHSWVVDGPVKIECYIKTFAHDISNRRSDLNIQVSIRDSTSFPDFSLNLSGIHDFGAQSKLKVIFKDFLSSLYFKGILPLLWYIPNQIQNPG
jgi:hypothetical protein